MILRDQVTRLRADLTADGYGNQARDWSTTTDTTYPAAIGPVSTDEVIVDEQRLTARWRVFLPPTADVVATDRITWAGQTFEIDGDVQLWKRHGRPHHLEAVLLKVTQT